MSGIPSADAGEGLDDMLLGGIRELLLQLRQRVLAAITDPVVRQQGARQPRVDAGGSMQAGRRRRVDAGDGSLRIDVGHE